MMTRHQTDNMQNLQSQQQCRQFPFIHWPTKFKNQIYDGAVRTLPNSPVLIITLHNSHNTNQLI